MLKWRIMAFKDGDKRPEKSGRKKGTPNKKTLVLDMFAQHVVEHGMERFMEELNKLKGSQFINAYMTLFEYVKPKLARTDIKSEETKTITANLNINVINPDDLKQINDI